MALGLPSGGNGGNGDILPRMQWNAKAGRLYRVDRSQDGSGNWNSEEVELKLPVQMVVDLENVEIGWFKFEGGVDIQTVPIGDSLPPKPSDAHKHGFRVKVYAPKTLGGVRHWNHTAKCVISAVDVLHSQFVAEAPKNAGKVPLIEWLDAMPVTTGEGARRSTNYQPVLKLAKWVARPAELVEGTAQSTTRADAPPSTGSGHAPPPTPKAAEADMEPEEFGA